MMKSILFKVTTFGVLGSGMLTGILNADPQSSSSLQGPAADSEAIAKKPPELPPLPIISNAPRLTPPLPSASSQSVSLGVGVIKPVSALYAQLPQLPKGCGFLLKSVTPGGTAAVAGLKPMDLIWKLGDQILINESQLLVLLALQQPGDQLNVSYFRSGVAQEASLSFQTSNLQVPHPDTLAMASPIPSLPMHVISYEDRSASISDKTGTATLTYRDGKPWLHVESNDGMEAFNDFVSVSTEIARVPSVWRSRLPVLQRSLEESMRLRHLPRVRHVPRGLSKDRMAGGE